MLEKIILNLTIIGRIPKGGRIKKDQHGNICLDPETSTQPVFRWLGKHGREQAMRDVDQVKNDAFEKANDIMDNKYLNIYKLKSDATESEIEEHNKRVDQLNSLISAMSNSLKGIENLKETYKDDATTLSRLDILITEITEKITGIKSKLDVVHFAYVEMNRNDRRKNGKSAANEEILFDEDE